ncbi:MAG: Do family serine endopeptidase [Desulfobacteraceae bacterium]
MVLRKYSHLGYIFVIMTAVLTLGLTQCQSNANSSTIQTASQQPSKIKPAAVEQSAFSLKTAIAQVARQNIPAVVHIDVVQRREISNPMTPFGNDPFFHFFFNGPQMPRKFKQELKGLGTGMLIDNQGHILTNNHVVGGATEINVLLADGKSFPAKLVGTDPKTDLAVIQITTHEKLPAVTFGDSDRTAVGDWVVAIGHPRGLDQTVTQGIISAKHRRGVLDPSTYQDYLQTDAAINPGNSGGPLLNLDGQVIGVNAAIATESGGFEGIGFAIPSNMAVHVAQALIDHGKVIRGWLGVSIHDPRPQDVKALHLKNNKGALVAEVVPDSPAAKAGLKKKDLVTMYKGHKIDDAATLQSSVGDTPVGEKAPMTVLRDGKSINLTVTIGNLDEAMHKIAASLQDRLGIVVRPLSTNETGKYGLETGQGVAIAKLDKDGLLAKAGFEKNDVILNINNVPVQGVDGFVSLAKSLPPHQQALIKALDHRTGRSGYVQVTIG